MEKFTDRSHAGKQLANQLKAYKHQKNVLVLGLPRGGVPVAYEVAKALSVPLDIFIVRKLGVPGHKELAMGAIASGGVVRFNQDILRMLHLDKKQLIMYCNQNEQSYPGESKCIVATYRPKTFQKKPLFLSTTVLRPVRAFKLQSKHYTSIIQPP